ncbi:hypothetical protein [Carboxylicivirga sp. N1Y90]|uniref:hypothetical protein n=1 Tax=Carboxylicivirga fragile TaxID=3417571 RepID=UPI003D32EFA5|nr:hypothetical protein [Marinilabiliaceae bacterium N1Y90]
MMVKLVSSLIAKKGSYIYGERIIYNDAKQFFNKRKAEFKYHIWTKGIKNDMRYLSNEMEKNGKKTH